MQYRIIYFFLFSFISTFSFAQTDSLQRQINQQVWKPFIIAFNNFDTDAFMAVHSKDMTRVIKDDNIIYGYDEYYKNNKQNNEKNKASGQTRTIELRFTQRIANAERAFEEGYYKYAADTKDGKKYSGYGKFHVLLRKENSAWKILMDADAHEKTDETLFLIGTPIE